MKFMKLRKELSKAQTEYDELKEEKEELEQ
jgi:hypothetical protein